MAKTKATDLPIDLREFIKEHDQRVYDFCSYLLAADFALDDLILPIFREFGEYYRRVHRVGGSTVSSSQLQVRLFQIAWQGVQNSFQRAVFSNNGRDTRLLKGLEDDILPSKPENLEKVAAKSTADQASEKSKGDRFPSVESITGLRVGSRRDDQAESDCTR